MNNVAPVRHTASCGGVITTATLRVAAASALVLMSGCHASPPPSGFAPSGAETAAEARLGPRGGMAHLVPFDESFYVAPVDAAAVAN